MAIATTPSTKPARPKPPRRALPLSLRIPIDIATAIALTCLSALASMAAEMDAAADIVAAHIRTQGYACSDPVSAVRDQAASRPNETVWMLDCGNARYRVLLVPNMAALVTQLD